MAQPITPSYARHRFPPEVVGHAVWLCFSFPLSLRMVEELLAARGVTVSHETVQQWALKVGRASRTRSAAGCPVPATGGIRTRWRSRSPARSTGRGGRSTRTAPCLTCWSRAGEADAAASGHDHGQAGELSRGKEGADARSRAPPARGPEQQGRELPPAD